jgi:hypothetical protein
MRFVPTRQIRRVGFPFPAHSRPRSRKHSPTRSVLPLQRGGGGDDALASAAPTGIANKRTAVNRTKVRTCARGDQVCPSATRRRGCSSTYSTPNSMMRSFASFGLVAIVCLDLTIVLDGFNPPHCCVPRPVSSPTDCFGEAIGISTIGNRRSELISLPPAAY